VWAESGEALTTHTILLKKPYFSLN